MYIDTCVITGRRPVFSRNSMKMAYSALAVRQLYTARQIVNNNGETLEVSLRIVCFQSYKKLMGRNKTEKKTKQKINITKCNVRSLFTTIEYKVTHILYTFTQTGGISDIKTSGT